LSDASERDGDRDEPAPVREPYAPPWLVRHGTIGDLTRGGLPVGRPGDLTSDAP
jgi:hypothetical protein